ncbi:MAG: M28 family peptidase [Phycisphaerales bacterium]|nr:M28 family peptidase [Phycisphaerales bacterium]
MAAISFVSWRALQPTPPTASNSADSASFCAIRALDAARLVLGEDPRPVDSAANIAAVARLKDYFASLGYAPQEQIATVKIPGRGEVTLRNIFIRKEGRQPLPAILLMSHHDSVAVSPGGSDNGMGVAVCLDAARMLSLQDPPERPVIILVTDGEEAGLLGAKLFTQNHAWANDIGAVINIDNRGGDGPAQLFETGPHDLALINAIAPRITHPVMSSFFVEIYRRMPNGTDLSAFLARGNTGINIACTDAIERYHTPADTFDAVNLASLQHEGDMATQALSGLCAMPANEFPTESAVFIDVFGRFVLAWSARSGVVLSIAAVLGVVGFGAHVARAQRQLNETSGDLFTRDYFKGALATVVALSATIALVMFAAWIMERAGLYGRQYASAVLEQQGVAKNAKPLKESALFSAAYWPPRGIALYVFLACMCVPISWLTTKFFLRGSSPWKCWTGVWSAIGIINLAISIVTPGAGAILLPIVMGAGCAAWIGAAIFGIHSGVTAFLAMCVPLIIAAAIYAPLEILSWQGVGLSMPIFRGFLSGLYAVFFLMLFALPPVTESTDAAAGREANTPEAAPITPAN